MKKIIATVILSLSGFVSGFSQGNKIYVSIAFIRSKSTEFAANEKEWEPIHKQLINNGKKAAWYLYKVKYPSGVSGAYDYVRLNIFTDWKQVEGPYDGWTDVLKKVYPKVDAKTFKEKTDRTRDIASEQLYQLIDQAVDRIKNPAHYIIVNQMKSIEGFEEQYVSLERTYFKPFHTARVEAGIMNNWMFCKRALPYGSRFDYDYITLNSFATWDDITRNNPEGLWKKVHGNVDFNEVHTQILSKRATVNVELWELVSFVVE